MTAAYLDSSAIVKLVDAEPESGALRRYMRSRTPISSALARVEVLRAALRTGAAAVNRAEKVLASIDLVRIGPRVLTRAAALAPAELRSLDAIHIATAQLLGRDAPVFVVYDARLGEAAAAAGLRVVSPR